MLPKHGKLATLHIYATAIALAVFPIDQGDKGSIAPFYPHERCIAMTITATESTFEQSTIERLLALGYRYQHGSTIARAPQTVVLIDALRAYLQQRYSHLPAFAIE